MDEERVRSYFLYLKLERKWDSKSIRQARASLTAFFNEMLGRNWHVFSTIKTKDVFKLPTVLTREEVRLILTTVQEPRFSVALRLIYECGLRMGEALRVAPKDIHRTNLRLHVHLAKGGKDRMVPLSAMMLEELTCWWYLHRNRNLMFPSKGFDLKGVKHSDPAALAACRAERMRLATTTMSESSLQSAFRRALLASGVKTKASIHTLRHSYATHLLEEGVSIRYVSQYLGHATLEQTLIYTHLTAASEAQTQQALAKMSAAVRSK